MCLFLCPIGGRHYTATIATQQQQQLQQPHQKQWCAAGSYRLAISSRGRGAACCSRLPSAGGSSERHRESHGHGAPPASRRHLLAGERTVHPCRCIRPAVFRPCVSRRPVIYVQFRAAEKAVQFWLLILCAQSLFGNKKILKKKPKQNSIVRQWKWRRRRRGRRRRRRRRRKKRRQRIDFLPGDGRP